VESWVIYQFGEALFVETDQQHTIWPAFLFDLLVVNFNVVAWFINRLLLLLGGYLKGKGPI
jgi:hypothetical protein